MPVFDSIIRETLRLAQPHTAMRRNMGPDTYIGGTTVPTGSYVVYPFSDVHLNSELYPDPWKFDPGRQELKMPFTWIGWGGGSCPYLCTFRPMLIISKVQLRALGSDLRGCLLSSSPS